MWEPQTRNVDDCAELADRDDFAVLRAAAPRRLPGFLFEKEYWSPLQLPVDSGIPHEMVLCDHAVFLSRSSSEIFVVKGLKLE